MDVNRESKSQASPRDFALIERLGIACPPFLTSFRSSHIAA